MEVAGKHEKVLDDTGNNVDVSSFIPDFQDMEKVLVVDAEVQYTCIYTGKMYVLIFRNNLSVTSMYNNLIPPSIIRELGLVVKDTENIHFMDPSLEDHSI